MVNVITEERVKSEDWRGRALEEKFSIEEPRDNCWTFYQRTAANEGSGIQIWK